MLQLHTLQARDNVMLDVVFEGRQEESGEEIRREIMIALGAAQASLQRRGVKYADLRNALTPQLHKREIALIFDTNRMEGWYGLEAAEAVLPLLDTVGSHSILSGDILCKDQDFAFQALGELTLWRNVEIRRTEELYCIYINNLGREAFDGLVRGMSAVPSAIGYADCTYGSTLKDILSTCVGTRYVKHGPTFISSHPFDAEPEADENAAGWPVEAHGFHIRSIDDLSFGLFMDYKIRNTLAPLAFHDGHFSLAAVTGAWADPSSMPITLEARKLQYLHEKKAGSLLRAGLSDLTQSEIADQLRQRMTQGYIFDMKWDSTHRFSTFATMIEFNRTGRQTALRVALRYEESSLAVVTLYG